MVVAADRIPVMCPEFSSFNLKIPNTLKSEICGELVCCRLKIALYETSFHGKFKKYYIKLFSSYAYKVHIKCKLI